MLDECYDLYMRVVWLPFALWIGGYVFRDE